MDRLKIKTENLHTKFTLKILVDLGLDMNSVHSDLITIQQNQQLPLEEALITYITDNKLNDKVEKLINSDKYYSIVLLSVLVNLGDVKECNIKIPTKECSFNFKDNNREYYIYVEEGLQICKDYHEQIYLYRIIFDDLTGDILIHDFDQYADYCGRYSKNNTSTFSHILREKYNEYIIERELLDKK